MPKASVEDLRQMFLGTLAVFKNKPYYILHIDYDSQARVKNLLTQREEILPIDEVAWSGPNQRLGYVNIMDICVYITRRPVRRYKAGLSGDNIDVSYAQHRNVLNVANQAVLSVSTLQCIELGDCVVGKYPTLLQARDKLKRGAFMVAFDRQFAIDGQRTIWYKNQKVGTMTNGGRTIDDIIFNDGFQHLTTLLGNNYEKTLSVAGS